MKKYFKGLFVFVLFLFLGAICIKIFNSSKITKIDDKDDIKVSEINKNNYPSYNGFLKLKGNNVVNEKDEEFIIKGVSSHGLQWYSNLITKENIKILKDDWNTNTFRLAMYTKEGGYIDNREIKDTLYNLVDLIIENDMYVIVDWHILSDNNPNMYLEEAKDFFNEISLKYKDYPNVIYEICNEPNGNVTMDNIYSYANKIIPIIRKNSPKSLIIVGTTNYSQDVDLVNKLNYENILYTLHFYSGTHKDDLRNKAKKALSNNIPIIVSEFGTSEASGNGGIFYDETDKWISFLKENKIGIISWSLSNKNESSAILKEERFTLDNDNLSLTGKYLKEILRSY